MKITKTYNVKFTYNLFGIKETLESVIPVNAHDPRFAFPKAVQNHSVENVKAFNYKLAEVNLASEEANI